MAEAPKFNLRNPAVKRIMQEIKEIKQDTSGDFIAEALETDIFEWHFVIRGPQDTEFEGGIYHGRILLPAEYPFKPPSFMMLTPNGRFETNMKICLSISSHHPEHWQPSWSVRTALMALIAFMPSPGAGALGALDFTKDERRVLAARSRLEAPRFGSAERQRVIDEMHSRMLGIATAKEAERQARGQASGQPAESRPSLESQPAPDAGAGTASEPQPAERAAAAQAGAEDAVGGRQSTEEVPAEPAAARASPPEATGATAQPASTSAVVTATADQPGAGAVNAASTTGPAAATVVEKPAPQAAGSAPAPRPPTSALAPAPAPARAHAAAAGARTPAVAAAAAAAVAGGGMGGGGVTSTDHMLTALMWALYVGIGAILLRKVMGVMGVDLAELLQ